MPAASTFIRQIYWYKNPLVVCTCVLIKEEAEGAGPQSHHQKGGAPSPLMAPFRIRVEVPEISGMETRFLERAESFLWLLLTTLSSRKKHHLNISHWYPACVDDNPMASSENKNGYYQSIKKYDGSLWSCWILLLIRNVSTQSSQYVYTPLTTVPFTESFLWSERIRFLVALWHVVP